MIHYSSTPLEDSKQAISLCGHSFSPNEITKEPGQHDTCANCRHIFMTNPAVVRGFAFRVIDFENGPTYGLHQEA